MRQIAPADRFAVIALAGEMAIAYGLLPWEPGTALSDCRLLYGEWLSRVGGGNAEDRQILAGIIDFIDKHGSSRFSDVDAAEVDAKVFNRAGYWELMAGKRLYLFNKSALIEAAHGFGLTYIRTYEGWLYLAVVLDLFSRQVVGWSMKSQMTSDLAIDALLMAVWRRKPKQEVMVHSDQGSQYSSSDWRSFLKANNLVASMSRRGNCHDNAVAESFFQLLKRERIKRKIYTTREDARSDVFDYIEMFYNVKRRHGFNNQLSPIEFEKRYAMSLQGV